MTGVPMKYADVSKAVIEKGKSMIPPELFTAINELLVDKWVSGSVEFTDAELDAKLGTVSAEVKSKIDFCRNNLYKYVLQSYDTSAGWESTYTAGKFKFSQQVKPYGVYRD